MTALPSDTVVTGTKTWVAEGGKVTIAGTVATAGVAELRFTVRPPAGAGAERFSVTFCVRIPAIVTVGCAKLTVAVPVTGPLLVV